MRSYSCTQWDRGAPQEGFLSVDLQKAFDTVEWPYLRSIGEVGLWPQLLGDSTSTILKPMHAGEVTGVLLRPFPHY